VTGPSPHSRCTVLDVNRLFGDNGLPFKQITAGLLVGLAAFAVPMQLVGVAPSATAVLLIVLAFLPATWFLELAEEERAAIRSRIGGL